MKRRFTIAAALAATVCITMAPARAQQTTKDTVPGITHWSRFESEVACSGAITPEAVAEIKKMGLVTIINLQESNEPGANVKQPPQTTAGFAALTSHSMLPLETPPKLKDWPIDYAQTRKR